MKNKSNKQPHLQDGEEAAVGLALEERHAAARVAHGEEEAVPALLPPVVVVLHREEL